jgi:signal transduction histidine kinase
VSPARFLRSSTARLALLYLVLFSASVMVLLGFLYWSTAGFMSRQTDATIDAEITGLAEQYSQFGTVGLVRAVKRRTAEARASGGLYLVTGPSGLPPIAGNLSQWPAETPDDDGWLTFTLEYATAGGGEVNLGRARVFVLPGGLRLLVGRDIRERLQIAARIRQSLAWGMALTVALAALGGVFISRSMLRRIEAINDTSRDIMAGALNRRVPVRGTGDEFDRLAENLNRMLDRIEALLAGMKEISDNVAHDLRSPLARLRTRLETVLMDDGDAAAYRAAIEATIAEADGLLATFNALLGIAQAEAGIARERFTEIDAATLAEDLAELYAPLAEQRGLKMTTDISGDGVVRGDRDLLFQALANLADNAIKFSPPGGTIRIGVRRTGEGVGISVADDGPGIPAESREDVRRRFVRLDESRTTPGSGLGLSLVDAVANLHDGRLILEDNEPGLRATLDLPC